MKIVFEFIIYILQIYIWIIFVRVILSWFRISPVGIWGKIYKFIIDITEPFLMVFKKIIPTIKIGRGYLDISPIIAIVAIQIILFILRLLVSRFL